MMARRRLTDNEKATILAAVSGILLLLSGVTGASQWRRTFAFLEIVLGPSVVLFVVRVIFVALGSVGGIFVLLGAYAFREKRIRLGKVLILLGTGFTLVSLILYVILQLQHGDLPFVGAGALGATGVVLSIVARYKAKPRPLLR